MREILCTYLAPFASIPLRYLSFDLPTPTEILGHICACTHLIWQILSYLHFSYDQFETALRPDIKRYNACTVLSQRVSLKGQKGDVYGQLCRSFS